MKSQLIAFGFCCWFCACGNAKDSEASKAQQTAEPSAKAPESPAAAPNGVVYSCYVETLSGCFQLPTFEAGIPLWEKLFDKKADDEVKKNPKKYLDSLCTEWLKGKATGSGCPRADAVGECTVATGMTSFYYGKGAKAYTKATAETDCAKDQGKFTATP